MPDVYMIAFYVVASVAVISSLLVFLSRRLMQAVISLAVAFAASSGVFVVLGQPFVALLQLLIFVGGMSTYLMVSLAADEMPGRQLKGVVFIVLAVIFSAALLVIARVSVGVITLGSGSMNVVFSAAMQQYFPIFYMAALLLFAAVIGGTLFIKGFIKPV